MLKYVSIVCIFLIWSFSFHYHFFKNTTSATMIAYTGLGHVRRLEHEYMYSGCDIWVFGRHRRRSNIVHFESHNSAFKIFTTSNYKHMLLLESIVHVPMMFDSEVVVLYIQGNETVATLWPRLKQLPMDGDVIEEWLNIHNIRIEKIHL
jgi:hypothetical protein